MDLKCLVLMICLVAPSLSASAVTVFPLPLLGIPNGAADKVYLSATDKDGHPTNMTRPNEVMILNCAYSVYPLYLSFYNGTDKIIFQINFNTGAHMVGCGFENIVSNPIIGNGWISIDFKAPYCYEDAVIKCSVIDQMTIQHDHKRYFPVGATGKPQITMDGENIKCGSEITGGNNISLDCHVYGVYPEGHFDWSTGCKEHDRISSEDLEKCLVNSTSIADCSAADIPESKKLTCTFGNGFGGGDCSLFIKQAAKYRPPGVPSRSVNRRGLKIH